MSAHVPIDVHSPDQLSALVAELTDYCDAMRDAVTRAKVTKKPVTPPDMSPAIQAVLQANATDPHDSAAIESLRKQLEATLTSAPVMHVILAANAHRALKRQLTMWFRSQIHPNSLLTFAVRSDIGGGIMLQAGSHFYDYSFKRKILQNKKRLSELASV